MKERPVTEPVNGEVREVLSIPRQQIRRFEGQPRRWFDPVKLRELAESIAQSGQRMPGIVMQLQSPTGDGVLFELIEGERRFRACELAGVLTFRAMVEPYMPEHEQFRRSVLLNFNREGHTPGEITDAILRLRSQGLSDAQIACDLGKSVTWVGQYASLAKLHPTVRNQLEPSVPEERRLTLQIAVMLSKHPQDQQLALTREITERGLTFIQAQNLIRAQTRQGSIPHRKQRQQAFKVLSRFAHRLADQLAGIDGEEQVLLDTLRGGKLQARMEVLEILDREIPRLQELQKRIRGIMQSGRLHGSVPGPIVFH